MTRPWPPRPTRGPGGFTLVEVLVALLIMSVIATMAWRGLDGILKTRDVAQGSTDRVLRLQSVIAQWEADLNAVMDTAVIPAFEFNGSTLRLTRHQPEGAQLVVWALHGKTWHRWASPPAARPTELEEYWMRSQQLLGNERGQMKALEGVNQWRLYYFRNNAWTNALSSGSENPTEIDVNRVMQQTQSAGGSTATSGPLPSGVRLELAFAEGSGLNGTLLRDVRIPSSVAQR